MDTFLEFTGGNKEILDKGHDITVKYLEAVKDIKKNIKDKHYKTAIVKIDLAKGYLLTMKGIVSAINTDTTDDVFSSIASSIKAMAIVTSIEAATISKGDIENARFDGKAVAAAKLGVDAMNIGMTGKSVNHFKNGVKTKIAAYDLYLNMLKKKVTKLMEAEKSENKEDKKEDEVKESTMTKLNIYEAFDGGLITESEKMDLIYLIEASNYIDSIEKGYKKANSQLDKGLNSEIAKYYKKIGKIIICIGVVVVILKGIEVLSNKTAEHKAKVKLDENNKKTVDNIIRTLLDYSKQLKDMNGEFKEMNNQYKTAFKNGNHDEMDKISKKYRTKFEDAKSLFGIIENEISKSKTIIGKYGSADQIQRFNNAVQNVILDDDSNNTKTYFKANMFV